MDMVEFGVEKLLKDESFVKLERIREKGKEIRKALSGKRVFIASHTNPDGDAIGSAAGFYSLLSAAKEQGKLDLEIEFWVPGFNGGVLFGKMEELGLEMTKNPFEALRWAEVVVVLDTPVPKLAFYQSREFEGLDIEKVLSDKFLIVIDHHIDGNLEGNITLRELFSSTCEIVTWLHLLAFDDVALTERESFFLQVGSFTDTGSFQFDYVEETAFVAMAFLTKILKPSSVARCVFWSDRDEKFELKKSYYGKVDFTADGKLAILIADETMVELMNNLEKVEVEDIVNEALRLKDVEAVLFAYPVENGKFKVSLRAKTARVNEVAREFGGGGHVRAAGCVLDEELLPQLIEKMQALVEKEV